MELNKIYQRDCIEGLKDVPEGSIDLIFADPPFNIGYAYDLYEDKRAADDYLDWTRRWGAGVVRALKPDGTFWLAIGDDFAAELKLIFHRELGLSMRSWVLWYYTFGVQCKFKFARSHTHLFHFVKNPKKFTFNIPEIRVPSARQLVYGDSRGNPDGRLPDDTWILRPQDIPESFQAHEDIWYFPRVCGTFKERAGWHGCQMPEQLLGRIIKASSNPGDTVLDPFGGSGSTLVTAKKLGRQPVGFELSPEYAKRIQSRLEETRIGEPLLGSDVPLKSAPSTANGKVRINGKRVKAPSAVMERAGRIEIDRGIMEAFFTVRNGFSADRVVADSDMNHEFATICQRLGVPGSIVDWNTRLMNLRKIGKLTGLPKAKPTTFPGETEKYSLYKYAFEIALAEFETKFEQSLDTILCDPDRASKFDRFVLSMLPEKLDSLLMRWLALRFRKEAQNRKPRVSLDSTVKMPLRVRNPFSLRPNEIADAPGLYWLQNSRGMHLYVGEAENLRRRCEAQFFSSTKFNFWESSLNDLQIGFHRPIEMATKDARVDEQIKSIHRWKPIGNYRNFKAFTQLI